MKSQLKEYHCETCDNTVKAAVGEPLPECCDKPMKEEPLPVCTSAPNAEMGRNEDEDGPCDDGRGQGR